MSARLRSSTTELEELGEETTLTTSKLRALVQALTGVDIQKDENTFKSIYDILLEIGQEWENLTDIEQASLSEALFGKRNAQVGFAILNNVERLQEIYSLAEDSAGSAMEEQEKYLQGVQYQIDVFQASVENLANTFMSSDFLKGAISTATNFINLLDTIIDKIGSIPAIIGSAVTLASAKFNPLFDYINARFSGASGKNIITLNTETDLGEMATNGSWKELKAIIDDYNNGLKDCGKTQKEFNAIMQNSHTVFGQYITTLGKGITPTFNGYIKYLTTTTLKTVGLKIATAALQGVLMALASAAITWVISKISDMIHSTERAIEAGEKAKKEIEDINSTLKTQQDAVKNSAQRFAELSQGIDQLTGKNISLSDEDYQEFLDISNELAEVFPSLSRHYDENGNAIVNLDGNVNTIVGSLKELLEVEQQIANQKILENFDSIWKGLRGENEEFTNDLRDINAQINQLEKQSKSLENGLSVGFINSDLVNVSDIEAILEAYNIAFNTDVTGIHVESSLLTDEVKSRILQEFRSELDDLYKQANNIQKEQASNWSQANSYIDLWLQQQFLKDKDKYTIELQTGIKEIVANALSDSNNVWLKSATSDTEVYKAIQDNVLNLFDNNEALAIRYKLSLEAETRFNNDEISVKDYQNYINDLLPLLEGLDPDTKKAILLSLGIELDSDGNVVNTLVNNLVNQLDDVVGEESAKAIVDGLTKGELEAVQNSEIDWSKILKTGQDLDEQINLVKKKINQISQTPFEINFNRESITNATEGIESLQSMYQSIYDSMQDGKVGEELAVQFTELDSLKEKLGNVSQYQDVWDNFYNTLSDGTHSFEEMEDALNQVLTAYVNSTIDLQNFDEAQTDAISTQLQLAGVTKESADAYVEAMISLAETKQMVEESTFDLNEATISEIDKFAEEIGASESTRQELALLALQKQVVNGLTINTQGDINNLLSLANAAGVAINSLQKLSEIKAQYDKLSYQQMNASSARERAELSQQRLDLEKEIEQAEKDIQNEILNYKPTNIAFDSNKVAKSSGGGGSKAEKEEDLWKKAYEKELADLDHLHEMEIINDIQYYEERERLNEKYFANSEKYAEDYAKNQEEIYKGLKTAYKSYLDEMLDYYKKSLDNGIMTLQEYSTKAKGLLDQLYSAGLIDSSTYFTKLSDYYGNIVSQYDKAINAAQRVIKKRIKALEDEKKALEDSYELKKDAIRTQINTIQAQIDATNKEIEKLEEANKARQDAIDMQKALYNLNRAENQRTQMVYKSDLGFVYEANTQDIKAAQEELENLEYERMISQLEKTVSTLEEQIEGLEDQIESLEAELDGLTENIDKQIEKMQDYSDRLGEVANAWTEAQEDMVAASIWGSDWQNNILDLNETTLVEFTKSYIDMQQKQADASAKAAEAIIANYNAQIEALNAWKRAQAEANETPISNAKSTTTSTGNSKNVNKSVSKTNASDVGNKGSSNRAVKYAWKGSDGKVHYEYGSGTDRAKPGYHEVAETGDEIILDNYGNAYLAKGHQLHQFEGGEKVFNPNETNELLRGQYLPIDEILPNYSDLVSKIINGQFSSPIRNSSHVISSQKDVKPMKVDNSVSINIGDIHLTEVDNVSQFAQAIVNKLPNALLQELNRK